MPARALVIGPFPGDALFEACFVLARPLLDGNGLVQERLQGLLACQACVREIMLECLTCSEFLSELCLEFRLTHGSWIKLLRASGFEIEDLIEVRPHADATTHYGFVTLDWSRQWPCEEVWRVRKRE